MEKVNTIPDPILSDFLYTVLFNASYAEKRGLEGKYLKAAMSDKAARRFVENSTDEEKKVMLSHFGYRFFWVLMKEDFDKQGLRDLLDKFNEDKKVSALKDIMDKGVFVQSDKEFVRLLSFVSRTTHHNAFYYDMEFKRQGYHIEKWRKRIFLERDRLARDTDDEAKKLASYFLRATTSMQGMKDRMGLSLLEMQILCYLYSEPHITFSEQTIVDYFINTSNKGHTSGSVKRLAKSGFLDYETDNGKRSYIINTEGVKVVTEYFKTIFDKK